MSLQIVIPVETLWALIALEGTVVGSRWLVLGVTHEVRHSRSVATVEARHHGGMSANQCKAAGWVLHVGKDGRLASTVL